MPHEGLPNHRATGADPIGYGKHSNLSYVQVQQEHREYYQWVIKTMLENNEGKNCDARLAHLGHWLLNQQNRKENMKGSPVREPILLDTLIETGLLKNATKTVIRPSPTSSDSGSVATQNMIQRLAGLVGIGGRSRRGSDPAEAGATLQGSEEEDQSSTASLVGK